MTPDESRLDVRDAADVTEARLLAIVRTLVAELRPAEPPRDVQIDDAIERDVGLDSLSRVELMTRIEQTFGVRLEDAIALEARTLADLLAAVRRAPREPAERAPEPSHAAAPLPPILGTPERARTLLDAYRWHLERHPERSHVTLLDGDRVVEALSFASLWTSASDVAQGFLARGIARGDTIAIMLPTGRAFFETFLGAMLAGAVPVPLYPPLRWSEIGEHVRGRAAIIGNAGARMLVTVPEAMLVGRIIGNELPSLEAVLDIDALRGSGAAAPLPAPASTDTAMLQYTSGSTGDPKGVVLSHDNLLANIRAMGRAAGVTSADRFVSWLPLYHDMGLIGAWLATMYHGVPLFVMPPTSFLGRPARWLRAIHVHRGTISAGPNFAYEIAATKLADDDLAGIDLSCWRLAFNGAEPVRAATLRRFAARLAPYGFDARAMTPVYGLAESAVGLAFPPLGRGPLIDRIDEASLAQGGQAVEATADASRPSLEVVSAGHPLPGHEIRVIDEAGREVPERTEGRVEFRGPSATAGYYRNAAATARLLRGDWLDTGDVGYIAAGELFLTSRAKDLIKRGGHNVHPYDLEAAIGDLAGIRKGCVAVFGTRASGEGTERVVVVAETHPMDDAARDALRERIIALAVVHLNGAPDEVLLVPPRTVLKTSSGKIRRAACRELYEKGLLGAPRHAVWLQISGLLGAAVVGRARRAIRYASSVVYGAYAWAVGLVLVLLLSPLAITLSSAALGRVAHRAARLFLRALAIPVEVTGAERLAVGGSAVIVANHASYMDAIVLTAACPPPLRFMAKSELAAAPLIGFILRRLGTHFVERVDPSRGVEDTHRVAAGVRAGETIVAFPEGTFSRAPGLAPFRLGAFAVSVETGAPVIPIAVRGTRSVLRDGRWLPLRRPVTVAIQPPIAPSGSDWSAAVTLRDRARESLLANCGEPDLGSR